MTYTDGTYLKGRISAIKDGIVTLDTSFSPAPLFARMDSLRQLLMDNPFASSASFGSLDGMDKLHIRQSIFHGRLVMGGDGALQWLPACAVEPVTPSRTIPYEIVRSFPDNAPFSPVPALFYTRAGDALPGALRSMDRAGAEIDSPITATTKLPAADLEAIQFSPFGRLRLDGFKDPGWQIIKGSESQVTGVEIPWDWTPER